MRRKIITILALALALMLALTGCSRIDIVMDIGKDGTVNITGTGGISEVAVYSFGVTPEDVLGTSDYEIQTFDGQRFYMADVNQQYGSIEEVSMDPFDEDNLPDGDAYYVYEVEGGYGLDVYIAPRDPDNPDDFGILASDGSLIDLKAGQSTVFEVKTPYPAKQVKGSAVDGITVSGSSVKVDMEKLAEHGKAYYSFLFVDGGSGPEPEPPAEPTPAPAFDDVPEGIYFAKAVTWAAEKGYIVGVGKGKFDPYRTCTEAEIVTLLWRAAGRHEATAESPLASSLPSYYRDAINWAYGQKIIDDSFQPDAPCTRANTVYYIWLARGSDPADTVRSFPDVDPSAYYADAVSWAVGLGIVQGNNGLYNPTGTCDRSQIATFLYRTYVPEARLKVNK